MQDKKNSDKAKEEDQRDRAELNMPDDAKWAKWSEIIIIIIIIMAAE